MAQTSQPIQLWLSSLLTTIPLLAILLHPTPGAAVLCYTPNGSVSNDRPCNFTAPASTCCTQGFLCTSNQLCQPEDWWDGTGGDPLQFIRGTCTDQTWEAPQCQGHCVAENPGGGEWVMRCGNHSDTYCCSGEECCSRTSFIKFSMDEPTITATAGIRPTTTIPTTTEVTTTSLESTAEPTTTSTGATTETPQSDTAPTSPSRTRTPTSSPSPTAPSATISSAQPTTPAPSASSSNTSTKTTTAIGIGVGVGVGIVLICSIMALVVLRMRRRRRRETAAQEAVQTPRIMGESKDVKFPQRFPLELETRMPVAVAELDGSSPRGGGVAELQ